MLSRKLGLVSGHAMRLPPNRRSNPVGRDGEFRKGDDDLSLFYSNLIYTVGSVMQVEPARSSFVVYSP